jgi:hypothetical protein
MPPKFAPVPKFVPGRVAPQAARYWPGKRLEEDEESSDEYDSEEEEQEQAEQEEQQEQQQPQPPPPPPREKLPEAGTKLITTMRSTSISEQGPYQAPEEDSSEEESEDEEEGAAQSTEKRKTRLATKRAIGGFHATDQVDLEEEEEVLSDCSECC